MKHTQNTRGRIPYTIGLFIIFEWIIIVMKLSVNRSIYGLFFLLILSYYIFGIFSLREKFKTKDFLISAFLNSIIFFILILFHRKYEIVIFYIVFLILQNMLRYLLGKIYKKNIRVLILGNSIDKKIEKLVIENLDYSYIGFIDNEHENTLGKIEYSKEIIRKYNITKVIYLKEKEKEFMHKIFDIKLLGIKVIDSDRFLQNIQGKIDIEKISERWFLESKGFELIASTLEKRLKRSIDIFLSIIVFIIGFPLMLLTYFLVKMDNPRIFFKNPAFFKQNRIGSGGDIFQIIKFRSMKIHDPTKHSKYASNKDKRITPVGKFIRKTRLDELPQIINVLKGDMSFVGPRPEWDELGRDYENKINMYKLRYAVKPGLTGWAQVMYPYGASLEDAKKKLEYDIYYIKYQSIAMDIIILFKTVKVVLFGKGI